MSNMERKLRIGMGQLLVEGGEPDRNMERALAMLKDAKENNCQILLLPETFDFAWTHPSGLEEAAPIPGKYSNEICEWAKEYNMYICCGLTEKADSCNYNSAILVSPLGEIVLKYRKINLLEVEFPFYEVGQKLEVIDTEFAKIGLNICADNYLDSTHLGHALARMGAQLILSPSSWTVDFSISEKNDPYDQKWMRPYSILAKLYNLTIVGTTSVGYIVGGPYEGRKSVGCSLALNENGVIQQGHFNEFAGELIVAEFHIARREAKGTQIGELLISKNYDSEPDWQYD